jgi:hypothetical protein
MATGSVVSGVCECMSDRCDELISLSLEEYERIRAQPAWFFVLAGHEVPKVEKLSREPIAMRS